MMDFTTGKTWIEINQLIDEYFDPLDMQDFKENKFVIFCWLSDLISDGDTFLSGSMSENTFVHPALRNGFEFDVVQSVAHIPHDIVIHSLEDVLDEPGYCRLLYNDVITGLLDDAPLEVKEINHNYHSTLYIVPTISKFFENSGEQLSLSPLKSMTNSTNTLVQSLVDTINCTEIFGSFQINPHGPAMEQQMSVITDYNKLEILENPKKLLYKFFENLSENLNGIEKNGHENKDKTSSGSVGHNCHHKTELWQSKKSLPFRSCRLDVCPSIRCSGWPIKAEAFFSRTRKWPDEALLHQIKKEGFHLVYKPLEPHSSKSVEWRFSFSKAEYILMKNMDAFKIKCYRILKTIYYSVLTMPNILCSYHLKNIFLWACERIPPEFWVDLNLSQIIMGLLDDLIDCLATKTCRHFFIPENNLFSHVHGDFLDRMAGLVSKIRRRPERLSLSIVEITANSMFFKFE